MDAGHPKFSRLFYKTFSWPASSNDASTIFNATKTCGRIETQKLVGETASSVGTSHFGTSICLKNSQKILEGTRIGSTIPFFMTREGVLESGTRAGAPITGTYHKTGSGGIIAQL